MNKLVTFILIPFTSIIIFLYLYNYTDTSENNKKYSNKMKNIISKVYNNTMSGKYLYIRHGETYYNKLSNKNKEKENLDIGSYKNVIDKYRYYNSFRWNNEFLDCKLNKNGIKQAEDLGLKLKYIKFFNNTVFSSPLRRCIDTALNSLKNHSSKDNITIKIHPLLIEAFQSIHDGSIDIKEKKNHYKKIENNYGINIDWNLIDEALHYKKNIYDFKEYILDNLDVFKQYLKNNFEFTFLNTNNEYKKFTNTLYVENILKSKKYSKNIKDYSYSEISEISKNIYMYKSVRPESVINVYNRSFQFKEYLQMYSSIASNDSKLNKEDLKIVVFTHSGFIKQSTLNKDFYNNKSKINLLDNPIESYHPNNGEILSIDIYK